jgi:gluconolactonase
MRIARRALLAGIGACAAVGVRAQVKGEAGVTRLDAELDRVIAPDARVEVLGRGYKWAEGPVWVERGQYLLFGDPGNNVVYRWTAKGGIAPFLRPSGLQTPIPATLREPGANGLALDAQGRLIMADSGTRAIVRLDLATRKRTVLADRFEGKRFNSPNDVVVARDGSIYFSDPPYGLTDAEASPLREVAVNGLYRLFPDGRVVLIDGSHKRPNGVALSPDGRTLYLALSDEDRPEVLAYSLGADGMPTGSRVFRDMRPQRAAGLPGLPDGMDIDRAGRVFASGPGGIHICAPDGRLLGIVATGKAVANCAIGEGGRTLFLTSHDTMCRVPLRA